MFKNQKLALIILSVFTLCSGVNAIERGTLQIVKAESDKPLHSKKIRVGLRLESEKTIVGSAGDMVVTHINKGKETNLDAGQYTLTAKKGNVYINGKKYGPKIRFKPASDEPLNSNKTKLRGTIKAVAVNGSKVTIINEVDIDHYLKGVLPREVISTWPDEALRAQAVASRSYLVANFGKYDSKGFDICADVMCQVYGGLSAEKPQTSRAVEDTRGEVMVYQGKPIPAYFHASSGGHSEQIQEVWGNSNRPYLPARKDSYGKEAPWFKWSREISNTEILRKLKKKTKVKGSKLKKIEIKKKSRSGRAAKLTIKTDAGSYDMLGNSFRMALGPEKIRSTLWKNLRRTRDGYHFEGTGWGHGIGMSQWGAKGRAEAGHSYKKILSWYYPKTEIVLWDR